MTIRGTLSETLQIFDERKTGRLNKKFQRQHRFEIAEGRVILENKRGEVDMKMERQSFNADLTSQEATQRCGNTQDGIAKGTGSSNAFEVPLQRRTLSEKRCRDCRNEERRGIRKRLSVEDLSMRTRNRSSLILDWLTNPENNFMFQGKSIDSRIFRSHSAVENRPICNLIKSTRFHSLRQQGKDDKHMDDDDVFHEEGGNPEFEISEFPRENNIDIQDECVKRPALMNAEDILHTQISSQDERTYATLASKRNLDSEELLLADESMISCSSHNPLTASKSLPGYTFPARNRNGLRAVNFDVTETNLSEACEDHLSLEINNLNLTGEVSESSLEHQPVDNSKSSSSIDRHSKHGTLRRINSDALFYKGALGDGDCINCEKRSKISYRKKRNRLSLQLQDLLDQNRTRSSLDTGIYSMESKSTDSSPDIDVNSQEFINSMDKIFSLCDLQQIRELAECGFDFNAKDNVGNCALHYAALRGSDKIITEILENGGNVWSRNNENQLPVELASNINVRMLLSGVTLFYRGQYSKEIENRLTSKAMNFEL